MLDRLESDFRSALPAGVDFASLRYVEEDCESLVVRRDVVEPPASSRGRGAMISVEAEGGIGYAATTDLAPSGLAEATRRALAWARTSARQGLEGANRLPRPESGGRWSSPVDQPWDSISLADRIDRLKGACSSLDGGDAIVERIASVSSAVERHLLIHTEGDAIEQELRLVDPMLLAVASDGTETQTRTLGSRSLAGQGGLGRLERVGFFKEGPRIAAQARELLDAPLCPRGEMSLILAADQMILQIHESIGHPLELDRILGDERNYAGTSFVTQDMFGSYRYGSDLLNVSFDPGVPGELASYGWDDDGSPAEQTWLIKDGILLRPLGGAASQARAGMSGVANSRASSWNRPPIDRMANLNLAPDKGTLDELVAGTESGIYMETNCAWSIDSARNKFQFGCEYARLIEAGQLGAVVRKPNYHGISANFWRSLSAVGGPETHQVMGTPNCGKGEPNQMIRVGHATPACVFDGVAVFPGE